MKTIKKEKLRYIIQHFFKTVEVSKEIYKPVIDGLIETSLRGVDSHGIRLLPHYIRETLSGRINTKPKFKFKQNSPSALILDADHTYGITASLTGMNRAIERAKENGVAIVVVKNSSHFGAAGIYGLIAARRGMISISLSNVEDLVVPYGGKEPFLGTNPFCFASPIEGEDPLILDMATTLITLNKLFMYRKLDNDLLVGVAVDKSGKYTVDPHQAIALTHFGGYKGYGIALMVEILCSMLTGGPYGPKITHMFPVNKKKRNLSHCFIVIDVKRFQPLKKFKKRMKEMVRQIRRISPQNRKAKVMVAGDPEKKLYKRRVKKGIPITKEVQYDFENLARELQIHVKWE